MLQRMTEAAAHAPTATVDASVRVLEIADRSPLEAALATRIFRAVAKVVEKSSERSLAEAVGAESDLAALLRVFSQPDALWAQVEEVDPLLLARLAGVEASRRMLELGGVYTVEQMADLLGVSRQTIYNRRKAGKLLAVILGRRGYRYPAWQIHEGRVLDGLGDVLAKLNGADPWSIMAFMLTSNVWLNDETPLNALRVGRVDEVRDAASVYGEQVAA